jgi:hypothetical protein
MLLLLKKKLIAKAGLYGCGMLAIVCIKYGMRDITSYI